MADTTGGLCFTTKALNCRGIGYQLRFKCFHCHQIPDYARDHVELREAMEKFGKKGE